MDATNVLKPEATLITDIGMDHAEILGPTLADIAGEKAGIIKPGVPVVMGLLPREAAAVIRAAAHRRKAPLTPLAKKEFQINSGNNGFAFTSSTWSFPRLRPSLPGRHQMTNAALAVRTLEVLRSAGFKITKRTVREGLAATDWPGRFQVVTRDNSPTVILDVCHNAGGAAAFAETFRRLFPGRNLRMILGLVQRKEHQKIVDSFAPIVDLFWLVPMQTKRSTDVKRLQEDLNWKGRPVRRSARLETAWRRLLKNSDRSDIIGIVGSHYLVGEFLSEFSD